jgi:MinD-like ATPase involved in chromosome partitioning or flagellar assembly
MYVVTFYSFKGGVGRSMALVNVAAELTRRGKKILIVDFDLEAPGLDTFDITSTGRQGPGVVDFVCDFQEIGVVPDVTNYIYRSTTEIESGELWVMPAGRQNDQYDSRFRSIDWLDLYNAQDGFLLFEDLRAQWRDALMMDYVLIDSRTGHTDVGGICTRQLPNSVVVFFFPNEQNRRGLQSIVRQIRGERSGPQKKDISLHFVMANVPDLDDEDEILEREINEFQDSLGFASPSAVIHHYDSLALLEQVTFTVRRPRSRLAKEFSDLTSAIVRKNLEDREGALAFLEAATADSRNRRGKSFPDLENQLEAIRVKHSRDPDVLVRLSALRTRQRKSDEALAILTEALSAGGTGADLRLRRAQLQVSLGERESAVADVKLALATPDATSFDLAVAIRMLREIRADLVPLISQSPALNEIAADFDLVRELEASPETLPVAVALLSRWLQVDEDLSIKEGLKIELVLCLIGKGDYSQALEFFGEGRNHPDQLDLADCFNCAMALWGSSEKIPSAHIRRVIELGKESDRNPDPNFLQCMSLVHHLNGDGAVAFDFLDKAYGSIRGRRAPVFSCWSYLSLSVDRFNSDLNEMESAFRAGKTIPAFIQRNSPDYAHKPAGQM